MTRGNFEVEVLGIYGRRELFSERAKKTIPTTLDELNVTVSNYVEPETKEEGGQPDGSPDTEREGEATLATGRQGQRFRCFRCGGNHPVAERSVTIPMVGTSGIPRAVSSTAAPPNQESDVPVAGVNATTATFDAYPELDRITW